jgi:hypothetical protein
MAQMATTPVFACRRCGKPVYVTRLVTNKSDPQAELLQSFMPELGKIAYCADCRAVWNQLASVGREHEFLSSPDTVIYNVIDNTGLDYYRRNG